METKRDINTPQELPNTTCTSKYATKLQRLVSQAIYLKKPKGTPRIANTSINCTQESARHLPKEEYRVQQIRCTVLPGTKKSTAELKSSLVCSIECTKKCSNRSLSTIRGVPTETARYDKVLLTERCSNKLPKPEVGYQKPKGTTIRKGRYFKESNKENSKSLHMNNGKAHNILKDTQNTKDTVNESTVQLPYMTIKNNPMATKRGEVPWTEVDKRPLKGTCNDMYKQNLARIRSRYKLGKVGKLAKVEKVINKTEVTTARFHEEVPEHMSSLYACFNVRREEQIILVPQLAIKAPFVTTIQFAVPQSKMFQLFEPELELFSSLMK